MGNKKLSPGDVIDITLSDQVTTKQALAVWNKIADKIEEASIIAKDGKHEMTAHMLKQWADEFRKPPELPDYFNGLTVKGENK